MDDSCVRLLLHDIKNQLQKMLAILHLYPNQPDRVKNQVTQTGQIIKTYETIYLKMLPYSFEEGLDLVISISKKQIQFRGTPIRNPQLTEVILAYCMWISKENDVLVEFIDNSTAQLKSSAKLSNMYSVNAKNTTSTYANLINELAEAGNVTISEGESGIVLSIICQ